MFRVWCLVRTRLLGDRVPCLHLLTYSLTHPAFPHPVSPHHTVTADNASAPSSIRQTFLQRVVGQLRDVGRAGVAHQLGLVGPLGHATSQRLVDRQQLEQPKPTDVARLAQYKQPPGSYTV